MSICRLPAKFSKVVWAQRGDYLIVEPERTTDEAGGRDSKVTGTIVHILFPEQVAHLKKLSCWVIQPWILLFCVILVCKCAG